MPTDHSIKFSSYSKHAIHHQIFDILLHCSITSQKEASREKEKSTLLILLDIMNEDLVNMIKLSFYSGAMK